MSVASASIATTDRLANADPASKGRSAMKVDRPFLFRADGCGRAGSPFRSRNPGPRHRGAAPAAPEALQPASSRLPSRQARPEARRGARHPAAPDGEAWLPADRPYRRNGDPPSPPRGHCRGAPRLRPARGQVCGGGRPAVRPGCRGDVRVVDPMWAARPQQRPARSRHRREPAARRVSIPQPWAWPALVEAARSLRRRA